MGRRDHRGHTVRHLGYDLLDPAQHHRADGEPRGLQPGASDQVPRAPVSARLLPIDTHVSTHEPGWLALSKRELLALVMLFALTLPAVTPRIYASDEIQ